MRCELLVSNTPPGGDEFHSAESANSPPPQLYPLWHSTVPAATHTPPLPFPSSSSSTASLRRSKLESYLYKYSAYIAQARRYPTAPFSNNQLPLTTFRATALTFPFFPSLLRLSSSPRQTSGDGITIAATALIRREHNTQAFLALSLPRFSTERGCPTGGAGSEPASRPSTQLYRRLATQIVAKRWIEQARRQHKLAFILQSAGVHDFRPPTGFKGDSNHRLLLISIRNSASLSPHPFCFNLLYFSILSQFVHFFFSPHPSHYAGLPAFCLLSTQKGDGRGVTAWLRHKLRHLAYSGPWENKRPNRLL
ncbi:hypothetical protein TgHK011_007935 [Trichoderma gracile]|nr:hypothetical protein TgHK011_007935 [Trichoderma gracile]